MKAGIQKKGYHEHAKDHIKQHEGSGEKPVCDIGFNAP